MRVPYVMLLALLGLLSLSMATQVEASTFSRMHEELRAARGQHREFAEAVHSTLSSALPSVPQVTPGISTAVVVVIVVLCVVCLLCCGGGGYHYRRKHVVVV